jgi:putative addiction module CopG family antidote
MNISLPKQIALMVEENVKSGKFASKSEFFRMVLREWEEKKLLRELRQSQKELKEGKGMVLKSLKDLR